MSISVNKSFTSVPQNMMNYLKIIHDKMKIAENCYSL